MVSVHSKAIVSESLTRVMFLYLFLRYSTSSMTSLETRGCDLVDLALAIERNWHFNPFDVSLHFILNFNKEDRGKQD